MQVLQSRQTILVPHKSRQFCSASQALKATVVQSQSSHQHKTKSVRSLKDMEL